MTTGNAALVDAAGIVENRIVYDPDAGYEPPSGLTLVEETEATGIAHIGLGWDGTVFEQPEQAPLTPPGPEDELTPLPARIDKLEEQIAEILTLLKKKKHE